MANINPIPLDTLICSATGIKTRHICQKFFPEIDVYTLRKKILHSIGNCQDMYLEVGNQLGARVCGIKAGRPNQGPRVVWHFSS